MSDILLKSMHFPSLDARYIVGDDDLSTEGAAADAKATGDALETKADKADTYTKAQVDDKVGDAKTELEEAVDDLDERKAEIDGCYEGLTSGMAMGLVTDSVVEDKEPYTYRSLANLNVGRFCEDTLVGGSVVWNQLVDSGALEVTVPNGHKYYANINGTKSIGASTGTAISLNDSTKDNVIDLTAALGSTIADYVYSLETATAGAGVAWARKYFPKEYYAYCEPHFEHVQTSAKVTVGFNQWDEEWEAGGINVSGEKETASNCIRSKNFFPALPNVAYCNSSGGILYIHYYDSEKQHISWNQFTAGQVRTSPEGTAFMLFQAVPVYGTTYKNDICINIHGDRDGEYEAYKKRTYPLDSSLTLRGIPKLDSANRLYFDGDVYQHDGTVTRRYGIRAYQSGDESLADAITDGTNTVYKLTTPTTETAEPYQSPMVVDPLGTEEFVDYGVEQGDRDVAIPVGHDSTYPEDLVKKTEKMPSPTGTNGDYVITEIDGKLYLKPYVPAVGLTAPTTEGEGE